jgi:hypothetical protein
MPIVFFGGENVWILSFFSRSKTSTLPSRVETARMGFSVASATAHAVLIEPSTANVSSHFAVRARMQTINEVATIANFVLTKLAWRHQDKEELTKFFSFSRFQIIYVDVAIKANGS